MTEWKKWDLSVLGEVNAVAFYIVGTSDLYGQWGLNAPAYFAYDDVAVRFSKTETALPNINSQSSTDCKKILHNNQVLIHRSGKTYSLTGCQVK